MFGKLRAPYAGGTGNSQAGPSTERQEREDEEGISRARQTLVVGFLNREGPLGMTIKELCKATGWHHGQASNALSILDTAGDIVRLDERRERQSVYVLEKFRGGRTTATRRRSAADKARADVDALQQRLDLVIAENSSLREHVAASDALVGQMNGRLDQISQRANELEAALDRERVAHAETLRQKAFVQTERDRAETGLDRFMKQQVVMKQITQEGIVQVLSDPEVQMRPDTNELVVELGALRALVNENFAHRASAHLRMTLEPEETDVVLRVARMLGQPRVQGMVDDFQVKVSLGVIRTLMRVVGRATKFDDSPGT
jgi:hypothetical protein